MKVGRNDPCPCGSGKKYKKCCMDGGNIIPFPGNNPLSQDPRMEEYKEYCEYAHEHGMPIPSFMEFIGKPNPASDFLGDIKKEIESSGLSSMDEINSLAQKMMSEKNSTPVDRFKGLTPTQIRNILNTPLEESDIIELNDEIDDFYLPEVPILVDLWLFFLLLLESDGKVLLNSKGQLPKSFCREFAKRKYSGYKQVESIKSEDDLPALRPMLGILDEIGYVEILKTRIRFTEEAYELIMDKNDYELFYFYLEAYLYDYNWETQTCNEDEIVDNFIQTSLPFSLYLLKKTEGKPFTLPEIYSQFTKAFPMYEKMNMTDDDFNLAEYSFHTQFFRDFCSSFGLVEVVTDGIEEDLTKVLPKDIKMKTTPLFKELFTWRVQ